MSFMHPVSCLSIVTDTQKPSQILTSVQLYERGRPDLSDRSATQLRSRPHLLGKGGGLVGNPDTLHSACWLFTGTPSLHAHISSRCCCLCRLLLGRQQLR